MSDPVGTVRFEDVSFSYGQNAAAMQLRAMNMTYESIKERGALMVVPSGMADSVNTGLLGMGTSSFRYEEEATAS